MKAVGVGSSSKGRVGLPFSLDLTLIQMCMLVGNCLTLFSFGGELLLM